MKKIDNAIIIVVHGLVCFALGFYFGMNYHPKVNTTNVELIDTTYNKVIMDSISYNIIVRDSTIIKLKKKSSYEIEQAISANDSIAVEQFKELAGTD